MKARRKFVSIVERILLISSISFAIGACFTKGADASGLRFGMNGGWGQAVVSESSNFKTEQPLAFAFTFEYSVHSRYTVIFEHVRSLAVSPVSTGMSFTGLGFKWYFWGPHPQVMPSHDRDADIIKTEVVQKVWTPYLGMGLGMGQSSATRTLSDGTSFGNAVGIYASAKLGIEYPLFWRIGARAEGTYGTTFIGSARIQFIQALTGLYLFL